MTEELVDALPRNFGRYRILSKLGEGGMGAVYLALDEHLQRQVAIKTPFFEHEDDANTIKRFYREARAAATIQHPNVCAVYDVGEFAGRHYLTMTYIDGCSISDWIRTTPKTSDVMALEIVEKLASGLQAAHDKGILHRDIKSGNTLITADNEPYLIDFGMARRLDAKETLLTVTGAIVGTPAYMAPEQINGSDPDELGAAVDIYSLGVILYELLTHTIPFSGNLATILGSIIANRPTPIRVHLPKVDPRIESICRRAMAKNPDDRYESAAEFAWTIRKYLDGGFSAVNESPPTWESQEPPRVSSQSAASRDFGTVRRLWNRLLRRSTRL